jgi:hypothetical protein
MNTDPDGRQIIPASEQEVTAHHLYPIAKFLIEERGHLPIEKPEKYGFWEPYECKLTRAITRADWEAVNERFVLPENIGFFCGYIIRDSANGIDIIGFDQLIGFNGLEPVDDLEAEIRERDGIVHRPSPGLSEQ